MNILKEDISWSASSSYDEETIARINIDTSYNLRLICKEIVKNVPSVVSVYLTGSYAASEGTILVENGEIMFISDYDFVIITKGKVSTENIIESVVPKLKNIYSLPGHPTCEILPWNISKLNNLFPTKLLSDFESAKCIYGVDIRNRMPHFSSGDIPLTEGVRLIFNRLFGVLIPFSASMLHEPINIQKRRHLTFESTKLILGLCNSLLILDGAYSFIPKKCNESFQELLFSRFPCLSKEFPSISSLIEKSLNYRVKPTSEIENDALSLWFASQELTHVVFRIYLERLYGFSQSSLENEINLFVKKNPQSFILNFMFSYKFWKKYNRLPYRALYKKPTNALLGICLYLFFSVDRNGEFNMSFLNKACDLLSKHLGITLSIENPLRLWLVLKQIAITANFDVFSPMSFPLSSKLVH